MNAPRSNSLPPAGGSPRSAFEWAREAQLGPELAREIRAEAGRRARRRRAALTLGTTLCLAVAALVWRPSQSTQPVASALSSMAATESPAVLAPERRSLEDGSFIELRPGAELRVAFTAGERRVVLLQGEAHFNVAKDAARPFVVSARGVDVRAVGTAFSVGVAERSVEVLVTEGVVAVDSPKSASAMTAATANGQGAQNVQRSAAGANPAIASLPGEKMIAGQRAVVPLAADVPSSLESLPQHEVTRRLAWRVPRLQFSGTPLAEVVTLFETHGGVRLTLAEAALGRVRVSGILRANNSEALLRLLAADHDIVPETRGDEIVLRRVVRTK